MKGRIEGKEKSSALIVSLSSGSLKEEKMRGVIVKCQGWEDTRIQAWSLSFLFFGINSCGSSSSLSFYSKTTVVIVGWIVISQKHLLLWIGPTLTCRSEGYFPQLIFQSMWWRLRAESWVASSAVRKSFYQRQQRALKCTHSSLYFKQSPLMSLTAFSVSPNHNILFGVFLV